MPRMIIAIEGKYAIECLLVLLDDLICKLESIGC